MRPNIHPSIHPSPPSTTPSRARTVDYCIGVDCGEHAVCANGATDHECRCEPGYSLVGGRCVDTQGLRILLVGPEHVKLEQGDVYDDKVGRGGGGGIVGVVETIQRPFRCRSLPCRGC